MITTKFNIDEVDRIFNLQRTQVNLQLAKKSSVKERIKKIQKIERYILDPKNQESLFQAMWYDLHKSKEEVILSEIVPTLSAITHVYKKINLWVQDHRVGAPLAMFGISSYIKYEPKGQVLIISPWNYPFQLVIIPLIHAIAAGNVVIVKPSEIAAANSNFILNMVQTLFPENEVAVIEGDVPVSTALLDKPFHHIFFTGSPAVGKIVMQAASKHLTSVTLELGGKSPVIVDGTSSIRKVAGQIAWAKCINNGQTCIAPDYLLIHEDKKDEFVSAYKQQVEKFYNQGGQGIELSKDYTRLINQKNFLRVKGLLEDAVDKGARILYGGQHDENDKYMAPTLLDGIGTDMDIMNEEIFGPILPIITFKKLEEVLEVIERLPKPLALYIMSKKRKNINFILDNTSAGGTAINELMITTINPQLPFGGINNSGIGKSNGKYSFVEFSNERGVLRRNFLDFRMFFPPYKNSGLFKALTKIAKI